MPETILIIEDEKELAEILKDYLEVEGYHVTLAFDGEEGLKSFKKVTPGIVLLDIMLPKKDGVSVCKEIRKDSMVPIIMVSAKNGEMDKVISLGIGADDYVTKPFSPLELVARVKAHLRRSKVAITTPVVHKDKLVVGDLILDKASYSTTMKGTPVNLTTKEFEVLYFFANNENQVFTKEQIYDQVWGNNEYGDMSSVVVYIKRLREKMNQYEMDYIKTIWGVGYKLSV